jgi:hypothetical protein
LCPDTQKPQKKPEPAQFPPKWAGSGNEIATLNPMTTHYVVMADMMRWWFIRLNKFSMRRTIDKNHNQQLAPHPFTTRFNASIDDRGKNLAVVSALPLLQGRG